jgi:type IV pilus assembly protein PilC
MPTFAYKARDEKSGLVTGSIEADTKGGVYAQLDSMGLLPVNVTETRDKSLSSQSLLSKLQKVKTEDVIFFTRQLHTVVRSGIPLLSGLRALEEQTRTGKLKAATKEMCRDIEAGRTFSDALAKHGNIFSELYISMVRAGETGGTLDDVLDRICVLLEFQMRTRESLKSAMRYPVFVVVTLIGAFIVLIRFVVPKFAGIFENAKMELPLPTRMLLIMNRVSQDYGLYILLLVIGLVVAFVFYKRTEKGTLMIDTVKLRIPLIGPIILKISMSRFANMFENLVRAGVPIMRTFEIVSRTVGNAFIAQKIVVMGSKIEKGKGIAKPIREAKIFPPLVVHLISTGEETGSLDQMLKEISAHYDREVNYSVSRLSAWIEPILTIGLSVMVLFMALAIFLPWWNMMGAMRGGG